MQRFILGNIRTESKEVVTKELDKVNSVEVAVLDKDGKDTGAKTLAEVPTYKDVIHTELSRNIGINPKTGKVAELKDAVAIGKLDGKDILHSVQEDSGDGQVFDGTYLDLIMKANKGDEEAKTVLEQIVVVEVDGVRMTVEEFKKAELKPWSEVFFYPKHVWFGVDTGFSTTMCRMGLGI